jgi:hypothetical protein
MRDVVMVVGMLAIGGVALPQEPFNERPADVTVTMSTSRAKYDGTYTLREVSRVCGEVPKELNFAGVAAFMVQLYPDGPNAVRGGVEDVTFDSKELVGGKTTSSTFRLSLNLKSAKIGSPPAYVLDTSRPNMTGTATLTTPAPGTHQLEVQGVNDRGETVHLKLTCRPRP